jgi:tetratricopeptide (TPR) repeat protein
VAAITRATDPKPPSPEHRWRWNGEVVRAHALYRVGRKDDALATYREAHQALLAAYGPADSDVLQAAASTAQILKALGRFPEALEMLHAIVAATNGATTAETGALARAIALDNVAAIAEMRGVPAEAEAPQRESLRIFASLKGEEAMQTLVGRSNLGNLFLKLGRPKDAVEMLRPTAASFARRFGDRNPMTLTASHNFGVALLRAGDAAEGARVLGETHEARVSVLGPTAPDTLATLEELAKAASQRGDSAEADRLQRVLADRRRERERPESAASRAASRGS